jgi:uncharacterized DUF497 family protein
VKFGDRDSSVRRTPRKRERATNQQNVDAAREFFDPDHSEEEERFLLVGRSYRLRVLLICHCSRESKGVIRIMSARRATKKERAVYHGARS